MILKKTNKGIISWRITLHRRSPSRSIIHRLQVPTRQAKAEAQLCLTIHRQTQSPIQTSSIHQWAQVKVPQTNTKLSAKVIANQCLTILEAPTIDLHQVKIAHQRPKTAVEIRLDVKRADQDRKVLRGTGQSPAAIM